MIRWEDYEKKESYISSFTGDREDVVVERGSLGYEDTHRSTVRIHYEIYTRVGTSLYHIKCWIPAMGMELLSAAAEIESIEKAKELLVSSTRKRIDRLAASINPLTRGRLP
jgi:hypothetical protein